MADDKDEKRELTTADIEPIKKMPYGERRELLSKFLEQHGITMAEFGKLAKLSGPMLSLFERGDRDLLVDDWVRIFIAMYEIEKEKRAKRKARFDELQKEWMKNFFVPFSNLQAIEAEQQRIVVEDQAGMELSKLMGEQWDELLPHMKKDALAYIRENPEKVLQEHLSVLEAKDRRIAELEQELRALKAKEPSNG